MAIFRKKNGYSTIIPIWLGTIIPYKTSINPKQPQGPNFIAHIETRKKSSHLASCITSPWKTKKLRAWRQDTWDTGWFAHLKFKRRKKKQKKTSSQQKKSFQVSKKNAFYQRQSTSCDLWTFSKISKSPNPKDLVAKLCSPLGRQTRTKIFSEAKSCEYSS